MLELLKEKSFLKKELSQASIRDVSVFTKEMVLRTSACCSSQPTEKTVKKTEFLLSDLRSQNTRDAVSKIAAALEKHFHKGVFEVVPHGENSVRLIYSPEDAVEALQSLQCNFECRPQSDPLYKQSKLRFKELHALHKRLGFDAPFREQSV